MGEMCEAKVYVVAGGVVSRYCTHKLARAEE
jgi:hypothetical protein